VKVEMCVSVPCPEIFKADPNSSNRDAKIDLSFYSPTSKSNKYFKMLFFSKINGRASEKYNNKGQKTT
jgi:hypothetical protein